MDRAELRKKFAYERQSRANATLNPNDPQSVAALSERVMENLIRWLSLPTENSSRLAKLDDHIIASYHVVKNNRFGEVDLTALSKRTELMKAHFAYPRLFDRFLRKMDFAIPVHPTDWMAGSMGIPQPRMDLPAVAENEIAIALIPGVVFGIRGERIGFGAGYYDRFLENAPTALRIGIAFDFQVLKEVIPQEPWDARMDLIVTESQVIEISEKA